MIRHTRRASVLHRVLRAYLSGDGLRRVRVDAVDGAADSLRSVEPQRSSAGTP